MDTPETKPPKEPVQRFRKEPIFFPEDSRRELTEEPVKRIIPLLTVLMATLWMFVAPPITQPQGKPPIIEVYFSPKGGATDAIIKELNKAQTSILVQAYSFTSAPISKALSDAHKSVNLERKMSVISQPTES